LADPKRESEYKYVRAALAKMGRPASEALIGVLDNPDPKFQTQIVLALETLTFADAKLFLLKPCFAPDSDDSLREAAERALQRIGGVPNKEQAVALLVESAKKYFNRNQALRGVIDGKVEEWSFDPEKKICTVSLRLADDVARQLACRLALEAISIAPENAEARRLFAATMLENHSFVNGLDQPPDVEKAMMLLGYGPGHEKELQDLLDYVIATKHYPAATAAVSALASFGKAGELLYPETGRSILIQAAEQPDRRLRLAACKAIVQLKPEKPYPGSSKVLDALAYFASGSGTRKAIVAGPNLNKIPRLASGLSAAGFKIDTAKTGNEVLQKLLASPDYELAMIDAGISQPPIELLVQQIRRDDRSADVRVGIIARAGFFDKAEHTAGNDPLTLDFPRPSEDAVVQRQVEQLAAIKPRDLVRPEERLRQAGEALDLLAEMSREPKLYDIRRVQESLFTALNSPSLAAKSLAVLANVNSPEAQQAIVGIANRGSSSPELRQAAADAFRANVQSHGVLLKTDEIRRQKELLEKSEKSDQDTHKVLESIVESLESKK
jgi:hypothetical protein